MLSKFSTYIIFIFLLFINIIAVWLTLTYGSFLGFTYNNSWITLLFILTLACSIPIVSNKIFKILIHHKYAILGFSAVAPRLYFLLNNNPVIPEEFTILVKVMPLNPILSPLWFFKNYQIILGPMSVHPPLSFMFINIGYIMVPNMVGLRLFSFIFSVLSVYAAYLIVKKLLNSEKIAYTAALFYSLNPLAIMFTIVGYTDGYVLSLGLFGLLFLIRAFTKGSNLDVIFSGILIGSALLSKSTIGYIWILLIILLAALFYFESPYRKQHIMISSIFSVFIALLMITPWAFLNYESFYDAYISFPKFLLYNFLKLNFVMENINPTSGNAIQTFLLSFLYKLFPMYRNTSAGTISYVEFILKLIIFLTPLITITAIMGLFLVSYRHKRYNMSYKKILFLTIWLLIPLIPSLVLIRDVRYFLPSILPVTIFSAYWVRSVKGALNRAYNTSLVGFMIIFLLISYSIATQSYAGVVEIKSIVNEHGIPHRKILTNYYLVTYMFQESDVRVIHDYNVDELNELIFKENYDCVIIWHHNRGYVPQFSEGTLNILRLNYKNVLKVGSNFSYIEIFYN